MLDEPRGRLKIAATYRVSQPMENFVLRVKIVQRKCRLAELFETEDETRDANYPIIEERDIAWQEKIFSPREKRYYADEKNCITDLHNEYRTRIVEAAAEQRENRLYTRTSRDSSRYTEKSVSTNEARIQQRDILKNRKPFVERYNKKVVDGWPPARTRRSDRHVSRMHVLIDLSSRDELLALDSDISSLSSSPDSQILLCTVTRDDAAKTLTIDPDFTENPYTLEHTTGLFYDYWIEHASIQPRDDDFEQRVSPRRVREHAGYEEINREPMTPPPPANILRLFVNLEIVSADKFPNDALFVTYRVDLPRHWITRDVERLTGTTQRCLAKDGNANFGYISEIPLDLSRPNDGVPSSWPRLIFTVGSIDSWTRYRIEGYASVPLPTLPGASSLELTTWRPIGRFVDVLRRFFTGGTSEIEDVTYRGAESSDSSRLERTSLRVATGGTVRINLNIVHRSKLFMKNRCFDRDERHAGADTLVDGLDNVLERFKAARRRMIRARAQ